MKKPIKNVDEKERKPQLGTAAGAGDSTRGLSLVTAFQSICLRISNLSFSGTNPA